MSNRPILNYLSARRGKGGNKYGVSAPEQRQYRGKTYDSKAEMIYAQSLVLLQTSGEILGFAEQPQVQLGEDTRYRPDFLVIDHDGTCFFVDVKGKETREWLKVKKLWAKYQNVPLRVVKFDYAKGTFNTVETIGEELE